jgi:hypothetical protein
MRIKKDQSGQGFFGKAQSLINRLTHGSYGHVGHAHFWAHALSRRQFIRTAAGVTGVVLGSTLWRPTLAQHTPPNSAEPKPIPGGIQPGGPGTPVFHAFLASDTRGVVNEPSTITDFNGFVGLAHVQGAGTDTATDSQFLFDADVRFMQGVFIGQDGRHHHGTFGFV